MVVSESFAGKTFGNNNPIGKTITLPGGQFYARNTDFTVKGVMKDFPQNSHFHPEFITTPVDKTILEGWAWTYLLLSKNANPDKIISGFKDFYSSLTEIKRDEIKTDAYLQKISDIHLHSNKLREIEPNSSMSVIYTLSIASLILLLIALANYANLNIGMAYHCDKFLFISKVSGSSVWMTLKYFLIEGIISFCCNQHNYFSLCQHTYPKASWIRPVYRQRGLDLIYSNIVWSPEPPVRHISINKTRH
jgi:putative ABC transport system permease protein